MSINISNNMFYNGLSLLGNNMAKSNLNFSFNIVKPALLVNTDKAHDIEISTCRFENGDGCVNYKTWFLYSNFILGNAMIKNVLSDYACGRVRRLNFIIPVSGSVTQVVMDCMDFLKESY